MCIQMAIRWSLHTDFKNSSFIWVPTCLVKSLWFLDCMTSHAAATTRAAAFPFDVPVMHEPLTKAFICSVKTVWNMFNLKESPHSRNVLSFFWLIPLPFQTVVNCITIEYFEELLSRGFTKVISPSQMGLKLQVMLLRLYQYKFYSLNYFILVQRFSKLCQDKLLFTGIYCNNWKSFK